jgi:hypothetical protein
MQNYDSIEGFEYWDIDAWKNFIKENILSLHNSVSKLLRLRDFMLTIIGADGVATLSELERRRSDILPFLLGGIRLDGEYKDNSLARLVKLTLGLYINPMEWIVSRYEGLMVNDHIVIRIESTPFLEFLKEVAEITAHIAKIVGIEPGEVLDSEIEAIIKSPEKLLEIIRSIYVECLKVSANHNYYTFFALSTKTLPHRYLVAAYPKLHEKLKEFLGLKKIFEPEIAEAKVREEYTIWGHSEKGLLASLYNLNNVIWKGFSNDSIKSVFSYITNSIRNLREEYMQIVAQKLKELNWSFPKIEISNPTYPSQSTYIISGPRLTKRIWWYVSRKGYKWNGIDECDINLLKLLDDLSPALFLGLTYIFKLEISGSSLEIIFPDGFPGWLKMSELDVWRCVRINEWRED